jgi:DNA recombination-dependent growth factor C
MNTSWLASAYSHQQLFVAGSASAAKISRINALLQKFLKSLEVIAKVFKNGIAGVICS